MASVHLDGLKKVYPNGFEAVHEASFEVADREFLVLVGPSGCGKSTLLRMIAGLEEITAGTLRIDDRVVNDVPPKDRDIAMVFQNYALYPHMDVFSNMAMGLRIRKMPKDEIRQRVHDAAALLGITELLDRRPAHLSGGQRQRVAVGRAIVRRPKVFLFDEPLSNLDAKMRVEMRTEISRLHRRLNATMIYVTHDQTEAMTMGDRIVVLEAGRVQQIASPLELYDHPANRFVAGFLGSPAMNFWPVHLQDGSLVVGSRQWTLEGELSSVARDALAAPCVLGVRPEDLHLGAGGEMALPSLRARAAVELENVEPLGSETYVYWHEDEVLSVARVRPELRVEVGETVELVADLGRAHLFDAATGAVLCNGMEVMGCI